MLNWFNIVESVAALATTKSVATSNLCSMLLNEQPSVPAQRGEAWRGDRELLDAQRRTGRVVAGALPGEGQCAPARIPVHLRVDARRGPAPCAPERDRRLVPITTSANHQRLQPDSFGVHPTRGAGEPVRQIAGQILTQ